MFYKIVKKTVDMEAGVYYYKTIANIDLIDILNINNIISLPHDHILLEYYPLSDEYVFSKYNYIYSDFDDTLEVRWLWFLQ